MGVAAVVVIECVDSIPFLASSAIGFYAILAHWDVRKYAIVGIVPPPTDGQNARCQRSIFGIKRGHNHDRVDERKTKERRKKDEKMT